MRWIAVNNLISPRSQCSYKKDSSLHVFEPLTSCLHWTAYSTPPTVNFCFDISCEFQSNWLNVEKQMRSIFARKALNLCKRCGELRFFQRIHHFPRISYINLPQSSMRWIFLKKCGELCGEFLKEIWRNAVKYLFSPHSPKSLHFLQNSPHSLFFSQKFTQKHRPGKRILSRLCYLYLGMASSLTILHCVLVLSSAVMLGCRAACPQVGYWERVPGTPQYYCYTLLNVSEGVLSYWLVSSKCQGMSSSTAVAFNNKVSLPIFNQFVFSFNHVNTDYFLDPFCFAHSLVGLYFVRHRTC